MDVPQTYGAIADCCLFLDGWLLAAQPSCVGPDWFGMAFEGETPTAAEEHAVAAKRAIHLRHALVANGRALRKGLLRCVSRVPGMDRQPPYLCHLFVAVESEGPALQVPSPIPARLLPHLPQVYEFEADPATAPVYHDWCLDNDWPERAALLAEQVERERRA